jgi:hypothetical protein
MNHVISAYFKHKSKVCGIIHPLMRVRSQVIDIGLENVFQAMEIITEGSLESSSNIFETERHFHVCKHTPRKNKCFIFLVLRMDLDLIIARESIHKGKYLTSNTLVNNIINEGCREVVYKTRFIQICKLHGHMNSSLLFIHGNRVGYPFDNGSRVD